MTTVRDFWFPAKSVDVMRARDFARWFWFTAQFDGEVACLKSDLDLVFVPGQYEYGLLSMYLCNQRIYSRTMPGRVAAVGADRAELAAAVRGIPGHAPALRPGGQGPLAGPDGNPLRSGRPRAVPLPAGHAKGRAAARSRLSGSLQIRPQGAAGLQRPRRRQGRPIVPQLAALKRDFCSTGFQPVEKHGQDGRATSAEGGVDR